MILRRTLLLGLASVGLSQACTRRSPDPKSQAPSTDVTGSLPPHCEALSLVWKTQEEQIKKLELKHAIAEQRKQKEYVGAEGRWWFDTDERRWTVTRPFGPGGVDSTHWFTVTYFVGSTESLSWHVDTHKLG
ncbi:MAG TPA: hypothetical protein VJR02_01840 [Pyrinomonadaceae bacterium]|nr:hypothetical protein [Pyrinomonadaceae bacterium]